jgi:hypothetical protein
MTEEELRAELDRIREKHRLVYGEMDLVDIIKEAIADLQGAVDCLTIEDDKDGAYANLDEAFNNILRAQRKIENE